MASTAGDVDASRPLGSESVMPGNTFVIDWITEERKEELSSFRRRIFRAHYGERVDTDRLGWNHNDDKFPSLGAFSADGDLVSCLRLAPLPTPEEFHRILLKPYTVHDVELPVVALGRAATDRAFAKRGLLSMLRKLAIEITANRGFPAVVCSIAQDDPRRPLFLAMGYEISSYTENWSGFLPSEAPPLLGLLRGKEKMAYAVRYLADKAAQTGTLFDVRVDIEKRTLRL